MRLWHGTLVLAIAVSAVAVPADAARPKPKPKPPVCNLLVDNPNDGTGVSAGINGPNNPNLDIRSADIATMGNKVSAAIRLTDLKERDDNAPGGRKYTVAADLGNRSVTLMAIFGPNGTSQVEWTGGKGRGVVDLAKKEIRMTMDYSAFTPPLAHGAGAKLTALRATAVRIVGSTSAQHVDMGPADRGSSEKPYVVNTPSCVKIDQ